jgi:hypothetical protein
VILGSPLESFDGRKSTIPKSYFIMLVIEGDNPDPDIDNTLLVDKTFRTEFDSVFVFNGIIFQISCSQADLFVIRQFD